MAGEEPRQERGLELLRERPQPGLLGGHERVRGVPEGELVRGDDARRRAWCGILPATGTPQTGRPLRTLVSLTLSRPLLLRPARRSRLHDGPWIRSGSAVASGGLGLDRKAEAGRPME